MVEAAYLPRSTPEAQGVSSTGIGAFLDAAERQISYVHGFMVLRHGHVVAEGWWDPFGPDSPHQLFSLSKSFSSTAIGLLVAERRLTVEDPVLDLFREDAPSDPSANLRAMRVKHLLAMSTGHADNSVQRTDANWVQAFLNYPVEFEPGTHFAYNSGASYMLSAIVQKLTGGRMIEYLRPRLFEPLGIENPTWETSPQGIDAGGWGLSIRTPDIARFGQLYLQRGVWHDQRLIPETWVEQASSFHTDNRTMTNPDWAQGYGYQFWRSRHNAFRGDGAFGQFCVIMPDQDAVVAINSGTPDLQGVLNLVWEHLLPAMSPDQPAADGAGSDALKDRLAALRLPLPEGAATSPVAGEVSGRTYRIEGTADGIESVSFRFDGDGSVITIRDASGEQELRCGHGSRLHSRASLEVERSSPVAGAGAWKDERTYVAQLYWYETPFARTLTCRFDGDRIEVDQESLISSPFSPKAPAALRGTAS
ncbi:MAG TPA: serine hydrolase [Candidatus Dormibacteraeota bacterium]|jgi:CubicO group peptidase (beta-lactamase class C family)|nr:serine hydrolase [Candidatus Dormibacteraeota bacterium]